MDGVKPVHCVSRTGKLFLCTERVYQRVSMLLISQKRPPQGLYVLHVWSVLQTVLTGLHLPEAVSLCADLSDSLGAIYVYSNNLWITQQALDMRKSLESILHALMLQI